VVRIEIANRINAALVAGLQESEVVQRLTTLGFEPVAETVEEASRFIEADVRRNAELLRLANFQPD
jgi:tripartite-type tricarboxylate transporter receptor subunit TctC